MMETDCKYWNDPSGGRVDAALDPACGVKLTFANRPNTVTVYLSVELAAELAEKIRTLPKP